MVGISYGQNIAEQIWTKGVEYAAQGKFKEAKVEFEKALKDDPDFVSAKRGLKVVEDVIDQNIDKKIAIHLFKGLSYDLKGQWDNAIDEYNKIIKINPRYAEAYYNRGLTYGKKGQFDQAIADFTKAIEINPRDAGAYNNRGNAYFYKGQYVKSVSDWTKAIVINPSSLIYFIPIIIIILILYKIAKYIGKKLLRGIGKKDKLNKKIHDFSNLPLKLRKWKLYKHQTIEIRRDFITFTEKGLFSNNWSEPVFAFKRVLRRKYTVTTGAGEHSTSATYYDVILDHPDKDKTLLVYRTSVESEDKDIRKLWEVTARALNLPALEKTDEEIVARAPEDLDKSIRDLAAEGKISIDFDPNATPPRGIESRQIRGEMSVTLSWGANEVSSITTIVAIFLVSFCILLIIVAVVLGGFIPALIILFVSTLMIKDWFLDLIGKRCILITSKEVTYFRETPFGTFNKKVIPLQELETV